MDMDVTNLKRYSVIHLTIKQENNMENFDAVMIAEGVDPANEEEEIEAWQHLIDSGLAWSLQGWFGRNASNLIEQGICTNNNN